MKTLLLTIFLTFTIFVSAQVKDEKARDLLDQAIDLMDSGETLKSIVLLEKAKEIEPENYIFDYEIGFAYYLSEDYKSALKAYKKTIKYPNVSDQVYQMLGNLYDINGNAKKALKTYEEGLNIFPDAGNLYLESGNVYLNQGQYNTALGYYEKGIEVDPMYPSNYYRAAKLYLGSDQKVWGMVYGETFMNIERGSKRTAEMSKLLFKTYQDNISYKEDTVNVNFHSRVINITTADLKNGNIDKLMESLTNSLKEDFPGTGYELTLSIAASDSKEINLESLNSIRTNFITNYFADTLHEKFPIELFNFHKKMIDEGLGNVYNYWLLGMGNEEPLEEWITENRGEWLSFLDWFRTNSLVLTEENKFSSSQF